MRKYSDSLQAVNRSLELKPFAENWDTKGAALYGLGKYADAIECYNKAIKFNSEIGEIWNHKGEALKAINQTTDANLAYAKAKELGYTG